MGFFKSLVGAVTGGLLGGPVGALLGASFVSQRQAKKQGKRQFEAAQQAQQQASAKADRIAASQRAEKDKALSRISAGRVRAARRRVRGGLFGDISDGGSPTLGG